MTPNVRIEPEFPHGYPPTKHGITWAVKQWEPILVNDVPTRICYDAGIETDHANFIVHITALIDPVMFETVVAVPEFRDLLEIQQQLHCHLEQYQPVGTRFAVHVLAVSPSEGGPHR